MPTKDLANLKCWLKLSFERYSAMSFQGLMLLRTVFHHKLSIERAYKLDQELGKVKDKLEFEFFFSKIVIICQILGLISAAANI